MSWIFSTILNWIFSKIMAIVGAFIKRDTKRGEIEKEAAQSIEPLQKAETKEEIDDASRSALDGL